MDPSRGNARGVLAMNAAMFCFIINDTLVKLAMAELPTAEIICVRGVMATTAILCICWASGAFQFIPHLADRTILWRAIGEVGATLSYLTALAHMPIGNVTAIFQATPLAVTAAAALFLGEAVGWRRWTAISIGFCGVLIVVRPGLEGFNVYAGMVLLSVFSVVLRDLSTARMPAAVPAMLATAVNVGLIAVVGAAMMAVEIVVSPATGWQPLQPRHVALLAGSASFLLGGYLLTVTAMRSGEMAVVAPFRYSLLIWSFLIGYLVFGDSPDHFTILGSIIVVVSGLYAFFRTRRRAPMSVSQRLPLDRG